MNAHTNIPTDLIEAHRVNELAKERARELAERIARQKAVIDAEQANRKPVKDDFWLYRTGPDDDGPDDPVFEGGTASLRYFDRI